MVLEGCKEVSCICVECILLDDCDIKLCMKCNPDEPISMDECVFFTDDDYDQSTYRDPYYNYDSEDDANE